MKIKILTLVVLSAFIVIYMVYLGSFANILTEYTPGFNQEKYSSIQIGEKRQKVLDILGKPFSEADSGLNCDYFSRTKSNLSDYVGWKAVNICYDANGNVSGKLETVFFN